MPRTETSVVSCIKSLYMDSLCSHHAEIQYLYLIYTVYNVIILPFHSCKKKREPFTALFHIDFLIHLSYLTVWQPMSLNFFPKMGQSLVLHQMPSQLLSFAHILLQTSKRDQFFHGDRCIRKTADRQYRTIQCNRADHRIHSGSVLQTGIHNRH